MRSLVDRKRVVFWSGADDRARVVALAKALGVTQGEAIRRAIAIAVEVVEPEPPRNNRHAND